MEKHLNILLADLVVEYHKLQNFHWYTRGRNFYAVHTKLEEFYDAINISIDEVAESMLMAEYRPVATLAEFMSLTNIKEPKAEFIHPKEIFEHVLADFEYLIKSCKNIKALADQDDNYLISASMDNYIAQFAKNIWMLKQVVSE